MASALLRFRRSVDVQRSDRIGASCAALVLALLVLLVTDTALARREPRGPRSRDWSLGVSANAYMLTDGPSYVQPTVTLDREWLHMEARYNYEALETGSAWMGFGFRYGDAIYLEVTHMLGWVFGAVPGFAVGYEATLEWWQFEIYSEGELTFDPTHSLESFFYTWSELRLSLVAGLCIGLVAQRTRASVSQQVQRGFFVGIDYGVVAATAYVFDPDLQPSFVLALDLVI